MKKLLFLLSSMLLFTACGGVKMKPADNQTLEPVSADSTRVVFMRQTFLGSAIASTVYDITDEQIKFIGVMNNDTRISYEVAPGKHHFMVIGESADFMSADMVAGKTYYTIVSPRMGVWKARFSFRPVRREGVGKGDFTHGSAAFEKWRSTTTLVENNDATMNWYKANEASVLEKYNKYWPAWNAKKESARAAQHMDPEDGM